MRPRLYNRSVVSARVITAEAHAANAPSLLQPPRFLLIIGMNRIGQQQKKTLRKKLYNIWLILLYYNHRQGYSRCDLWWFAIMYNTFKIYYRYIIYRSLEIMWTTNNATGRLFQCGILGLLRQLTVKSQIVSVAASWAVIWCSFKTHSGNNPKNHVCVQV